MLPAARLARRSRRSRRSRPPLSSFPSRQRTSFPELVGRSPRQAASVISSHGSFRSILFMQNRSFQIFFLV